MKVTSLVENTANKYGIETEHGLSLYIETGSNTILFVCPISNKIVLLPVSI